MKDIVLITSFNRDDFLSVMLDYILKADKCDEHVYLFSLEKNYNKNIDGVIDRFPLEKIVRKNPMHPYRGNSLNTLEGYKYALSLVSKYNSNLIYLIEDDIFIGKDFFSFHSLVQSKFDSFSVSAVKNQNLKHHPEIVKDPELIYSIKEPNAVYKFPQYQSLGVSWKPENIRKVVSHGIEEYYRDMRKYVLKYFPNSRYNNIWVDQDGLIDRIMEVNNYQVIFPYVPRAYHAGFYGCYRRGTPLVGQLEQRVERLKTMTQDEMNAQAIPQYKDIEKCNLGGYGITDFVMKEI